MLEGCRCVAEPPFGGWFCVDPNADPRGRKSLGKDKRTLHKTEVEEAMVADGQTLVHPSNWCDYIRTNPQNLAINCVPIFGHD